MNFTNEIIGLRKKEQFIALVAYVVMAVAMFLPYASVGGKTIIGFTAAFSGAGTLYMIMGVLVLVMVAAGAFLFFRPSVKGVHLWTWIGAVLTAVVVILLFGSKMIFDKTDIFPGKFMVKDFRVGYWLLLVGAFVGLYYAMSSTKTSPASALFRRELKAASPFRRA